MIRKLVKVILTCAVALTVLTACSGGSSAGNIFSSEAYTKKVNDKLATKGSSIVLQNDDAMVAKAKILANGMNISASEINGMTEVQIEDYATKKLMKAYAAADIDTRNEDFVHLYDGTEEELAEKLAGEIIKGASYATVNKIGFAKSKIGNDEVIWGVYNYTYLK